MLEKLGRWGSRLASTSPWTNVYGLARSLLAAGTFGTLLFSSTDALFHPVLGLPPAPYCQSVAQISLFCLASEHLEVARWLAVVILGLVISGWRPRWTALPHWWVAFSLQASIAIPDGGDAVNAILTLLILPVALTDGRRWHWNLPEGFGSSPATAWEASRRVTAHITLLFIRLQVAVIYFHAAVGKMAVPEWVDGTALYYWFTHPTFGTPDWIKPLMLTLVTTPLTLALMNWGAIVLELLLALGLVMPKRTWRYLFAAGISFHLIIAVLMGLISFGLAMFGALLLYLRPIDQPLTLPKAVKDARKRLLGTLLPIRWARPQPEGSKTSQRTTSKNKSATPNR